MIEITDVRKSFGALQVLGHERGQVNRVGVDGHRGDSFSRAFAGLLKDHAVAVAMSRRHAQDRPVVHHARGLNCAQQFSQVRPGPPAPVTAPRPRRIPPSSHR